MKPDCHVMLIRRPRTLPSGKKVHYWYLRWTATDGREQNKSIGRTDKVTKKQAKLERDKVLTGITSGAIPQDRPRAMTLADFADMYPKRRRQGHTGRGYLRGAPKLSEATITEHKMTIRYMCQHFGDDRLIDTITVTQAETFIDTLAAGKLAAARNVDNREYTLGEQTVRGHIRNAKAIYNWARRFGHVSGNPFTDFDGAPLPSKAGHYVPVEDLEALIAAAPTPGWKAMYGLCRLAGLRRDEARTLPWSGPETDGDGEEHAVGVDWSRKRLCLVAGKTRKYREVPICPRLAEILEDAKGMRLRPEGSVTGLSSNNLTRLAQAHIRGAGLAPWPKTYQAMRASCENDWKTAGIAEPTYAAWLGHSPTVSRKHYVAPTEAEFEMIAKTG